MATYDFTIIGGGIVGLSTALALARRENGATVLVLEKESACAPHQTGHNSGVIHSGIYYKPGSLKAKFAREGNLALVEFCREHGIPHDVCGKVIVATNRSELPLLENLYKRGLENGLEVIRITAEKVRRSSLMSDAWPAFMFARLASSAISKSLKSMPTFSRAVEGA